MKIIDKNGNEVVGTPKNRGLLIENINNEIIVCSVKYTQDVNYQKRINKKLIKCLKN